VKSNKYEQNFSNDNYDDDEYDRRKFKKNNLREKRREKENTRFAHLEDFNR
jgi:hypothetical protein